MAVPRERAAGKAWIALHVIALASLACYWAMGYSASRIERLLHEYGTASFPDMSYSLRVQQCRLPGSCE
jgi:hypothetical protein